jgi:hypothetical protein
VINVMPPNPAEAAPPSAPEVREEKDPMWFWNKIAEIPADQWNRVYDVMLTRLEPRVPGVPGSKGYLAMFTEPVRLPQIKNMYGGGKYQVVLSKNGRFVTSHNFDIEGTPKYDLTRENPSAAPAGAGPTDQQGLISLLRELVDKLQSSPTVTDDVKQTASSLLQEAAKSSIEMVKAQVPKATNASEELRSLIGTLKDLNLVGTTPATATSSNPLIDKVLGLLVEKALTPPDPLAQLTVYMTLFEKLEGLRGEGRGGKKDWVSTAIEKGAEILPRVLDEVHASREANVEVARTRLATAQTMRGVPPPPAPGAPPSPGTAAVLASPGGRTGLQVERLNGEPSAAQAEAAAAAPAVPMIDPNSSAYQNFVKARVVDLIDQNYEAPDIVAYLDGALPGFCDQLMYPEQVVEASMREDPILVRAVDHPRWKKLFAQVRDFIKQNAEEEIPSPKIN